MALLSTDCKRFYDEGKRHLFATFEAIALETWRDQNQRAYFVTDKTIMGRFRLGWVYDTTDKEHEQADTIPELAKRLGLAPNELENIVKEFNVACNKNEFNLMKLDGKATTGLKSNKTNWVNPIDTPPYYGYPMTANLKFTYGVVKTNTDAQVLSTKCPNSWTVCGWGIDQAFLPRISSSYICPSILDLRSHRRNCDCEKGMNRSYVESLCRGSRSKRRSGHRRFEQDLCYSNPSAMAFFSVDYNSAN